MTGVYYSVAGNDCGTSYEVALDLSKSMREPITTRYVPILKSIKPNMERANKIKKYFNKLRKEKE